MGTRSGDVDPALVGLPRRARRAWPSPRPSGGSTSASGLLGLSGRQLATCGTCSRASASDPRARLAVEVFCHRARKYLGAYLAVLGGADAVVFSGGIGEHAHEVRARICAGMEWIGLVVDPERNAAAVGRAGRLSPDDARLPPTPFRPTRSA